MIGDEEIVSGSPRGPERRDSVLQNLRTVPELGARMGSEMMSMTLEEPTNVVDYGIKPPTEEGILLEETWRGQIGGTDVNVNRRTKVGGGYTRGVGKTSVQMPWGSSEITTHVFGPENSFLARQEVVDSSAADGMLLVETVVTPEGRKLLGSEYGEDAEGMLRRMKERTGQEGNVRQIVVVNKGSGEVVTDNVFVKGTGGDILYDRLKKVE